MEKERDYDSLLYLTEHSIVPNILVNTVNVKRCLKN